MSEQCNWCHTNNNLTEIYTGDDVDGEKEFICPACLKEKQSQEDIDFCECCGSDIAYYTDDLDDKLLCPEHKGEFDLDEEEQQDMEDLIENITKDG
ncbi:MAG: hypothetical protein WCP01_14175 [Methylococcaceae bacterium]